MQHPQTTSEQNVENGQTIDFQGAGPQKARTTFFLFIVPTLSFMFLCLILPFSLHHAILSIFHDLFWVSYFLSIASFFLSVSLSFSSPLFHCVDLLSFLLSSLGFTLPVMYVSSASQCSSWYKAPQPQNPNYCYGILQ